MNNSYEYTLSMADDQSPTGRANICILRYKQEMNVLKVNYSIDDILALKLQCNDSTGEIVPIMPVEHRALYGDIE